MPFNYQTIMVFLIYIHLDFWFYFTQILPIIKDDNWREFHSDNKVIIDFFLEDIETNRAVRNTFLDILREFLDYKIRIFRFKKSHID